MSISITAIVNAATPEFDAFARETRRAVASGKLVVAAAGNTPPPGFTQGTNSPPWIVRVGGVIPVADGASVYSSKFPDVAANYTARVPRHDSRTDSVTQSGTSFSAPLVAGSLARAIGLVRAAWGPAVEEASLARAPGLAELVIPFGSGPPP